MALDNEQLAHLARLAHLEIDPAEIDRLRANMEKMVELAARVAAAATADSPPGPPSEQASQPLRPDKPRPPAENLSRLAPEADAGMVAVPKVIE